MPQLRLDRLVIDAERVQVRCKSAPESVPAVPAGNSWVLGESVSLGLVFRLGFAAGNANRKGWNDCAPREVWQIERASMVFLAASSGDSGFRVLAR